MRLLASPRGFEPRFSEVFCDIGVTRRHICKLSATVGGGSRWMRLIMVIQKMHQLRMQHTDEPLRSAQARLVDPTARL